MNQLVVVVVVVSVAVVASFVVAYYASAFNLELAGQRTFWPKYSNDF